MPWWKPILTNGLVITETVYKFLSSFICPARYGKLKCCMVLAWNMPVLGMVITFSELPRESSKALNRHLLVKLSPWSNFLKIAANLSAVFGKKLLRTFTWPRENFHLVSCTRQCADQSAVSAGKLACIVGVILRARVELNRAFFTGELWINSCVRQLGSGKTLTSPPLVLFLTYPSVSSVLLTQNGGGGRGGVGTR